MSRTKQIWIRDKRRTRMIRKPLPGNMVASLPPPGCLTGGAADLPAPVVTPPTNSGQQSCTLIPHWTNKLPRADSPADYQPWPGNTSQRTTPRHDLPTLQRVQSLAGFFLLQISSHFFTRFNVTIQYFFHYFLNPSSTVATFVTSSAL